MDTTDEIEVPIDTATQAKIDALAAETSATAARIDSIVSEANESLDAIAREVETVTGRIHSSMQSLDAGDAAAGESLDLLMMRTAEDLAN